MSGAMREPEATVEIRQGTYWRSLVDIEDQAIPAGTTLLVASIRDVDNTAHTIVLRPHPSMIGRTVEVPFVADGEVRRRRVELDEHRFLVQDFLAKFAPEPVYAAIRKAELARVQTEIASVQEDLSSVERSPALRERLDAGIRAWERESGAEPGSTAALSVPSNPLSVALTAESVGGFKLAAARRAKAAEIKAAWIQERAEEIARLVERTVPFYQEQAAAALAATEDVRRFAVRVQKGVESLDLYVGTGVEVEEIARGESAPEDEPLTVAQRKIYADEELSVWADVGDEFDFRSRALFSKKLAGSAGLRDQIFPTRRSVVAFAMRRRAKSYGDPWIDEKAWEQNRLVGLLVRDGENVYAVHSPIDSHLRARNLFPSKADIEAIFRDKSFDKEGRIVGFDDVLYTDKLEEHERWALHYKRFLILLAGLDHRLNLFGTFYPGPKGLDFISRGFQERHMRFVHDEDGEGMLPKPGRPPLAEWIAGRNKLLKPGSRVFCLWQTLMTPATAPSCAKTKGYLSYAPERDASVAIARSRAGSVVVGVEVSGHGPSGRRTFEAEVDVSLFEKRGEGEGRLGYLVLDGVRADDLEGYIFDRDAREDHLEYMRLFKRAAAFLREDEKRQARGLAKLREAVGRIASPGEADLLADRAVAAWRSARRWADLPEFETGDDPEWRSLLDQAYAMAEAERERGRAEALAAGMAREPLRLAMTGKGRMLLYCAPLAGEIDDRLAEHASVRVYPLARSKDGVKLAGGREGRWIGLPAHSTSENTLCEWPGAAVWAAKKELIGHEAKLAMLELSAANWLRGSEPATPALLRASLGRAEWDEAFGEWLDMAKDRRLRKTSRVRNPRYMVPFGAARTEAGFQLAAVGAPPETLLVRLAPDEESRERMADAWSRRYAASEDQRASLMGFLDGAPPLSCYLVEKVSAAWRGGLVSEHIHSLDFRRTEKRAPDLAGVGRVLAEHAARERRYHAKIFEAWIDPRIAPRFGIVDPSMLAWRECERCSEAKPDVAERVDPTWPWADNATRLWCAECEAKARGAAEEERETA